MSNIETHVEELNREIAELKRLVDFDTKAILKDGDTIFLLRTEISGLKAECSKEYNKCEDTQCKLEDAQEEIAELKYLAAHAEQRANIAEKANDALVLKNASLNSQAVNQVKMYNEKVDEITELKEWQRKAFDCYPNIDIDIAGLET